MSPAAASPRELRVTVRGRPVRVLSAGSGPAVVLVHGLGLAGDLWRPHLERLARAGYRAVAPDLPGYGETGGAGIRSVDEVARWLGRLADALELEAPGWVGHSVGAQHVTRLAFRTPHRVSALVLAAPTGRTGRHPIRQFTGLAWTAAQVPPGLVASVLRRYAAAPATTIRAWGEAFGHDLALDAPRVPAPTLLVRGTRDRVVPGSFVRSLAELFPDARLMQIEGATHAVALDPAPFVDATLRFLQRRYCSTRP